MSEEAAPAGDPAATPATEESAESKAKRTRTVWPIRIFVVEAGSPLKLALVDKSPEFSDAEKASAWIKENGDAALTYAPARVGPGLSPTLVLKEKSLFKAAPTG